MLCDPSHICGRRDLIPAVAQEALDLLFDGLMLEVHPDPERALSDAEQQLTPAQFFELVARLNLSSETGGNSGFSKQMSELRGEVDQLDERLLQILSERMNVVRKMGELKAAQHVSTFQPHRWQEIVDDRVRKGTALDLSEHVVMEIMQSIHEEAIRQQEIRRVNGVE